MVAVASPATLSLAKRAGQLVKMYFTYVLKSKKDNKLYIGCTNNIKVRIEKHNKGQVMSTKDRRPLELLYFEACLNKQSAYKREKYFKTGFGRKFLKTRI